MVRTMLKGEDLKEWENEWGESLIFDGGWDLNDVIIASFIKKMNAVIKEEHGIQKFYIDAHDLFEDYEYWESIGVDNDSLEFSLLDALAEVMNEFDIVLDGMNRCVFRSELSSNYPSLKYIAPLTALDRSLKSLERAIEGIARIKPITFNDRLYSSNMFLTTFNLDMSIQIEKEMYAAVDREDFLEAARLKKQIGSLKEK